MTYMLLRCDFLGGIDLPRQVQLQGPREPVFWDFDEPGVPQCPLFGASKSGSFKGHHQKISVSLWFGPLFDSFNGHQEHLATFFSLFFVFFFLGGNEVTPESRQCQWNPLEHVQGWEIQWLRSCGPFWATRSLFLVFFDMPTTQKSALQDPFPPEVGVQKPRRGYGQRP